MDGIQHWLDYAKEKGYNFLRSCSRNGEGEVLAIFSKDNNLYVFYDVKRKRECKPLSQEDLFKLEDTLNELPPDQVGLNNWDMVFYKENQDIIEQYNEAYLGSTLEEVRATLPIFFEEAARRITKYIERQDDIKY